MGALAGIAARLTGGIGLYLMLGAAFLAWTAYQRHDAAVKARAECQAAQLQATLDETIRQRTVAENALARAQERADAAVIELKGLDDELAKTKADLGADAAGGCHIPRAATKRLHNIR